MSHAWPLPDAVAARVDALVGASWIQTTPTTWTIAGTDATASMTSIGPGFRTRIFVQMRDAYLQVVSATAGPCPRALLALAAGPETRGLLRHLALLAQAHPAHDPQARPKLALEPAPMLFLPGLAPGSGQKAIHPLARLARPQRWTCWTAALRIVASSVGDGWILQSAPRHLDLPPIPQTAHARAGALAESLPSPDLLSFVGLEIP